MGRLRSLPAHDELGEGSLSGVLPRVNVILASAPGVIDAPDAESTDRGLGEADWRVTVYNNDHNTYEEVIEVLMLATNCTPQEAYIETWEIDNLGKSIVHYASEYECRNVAEIIARIGIRVEIDQEP